MDFLRYRDYTNCAPCKRFPLPDRHPNAMFKRAICITMSLGKRGSGTILPSPTSSIKDASFASQTKDCSCDLHTHYRLC